MDDISGLLEVGFMARKIRMEEDQVKSAETTRRAVQNIMATEHVNPMPLRTKLVLIIEPIILVALGVVLAITNSIWMGILGAAVLTVGPLTAFISDRRIRPSKVTIDNEGVTPHFGSKPTMSIPWSLVVLMPRSKSYDGSSGGFLVQEGRRMPYMISNEIFMALTDAYRKRVGKDPW